MKYFTKEELEDITKELLENPTRETLKSLNNKYNNENDEEKTLLQITPEGVVEVSVPEPLPTPIVPMINEVVENKEANPVVEPIASMGESVVVPLPSSNTPSMELSKTESTLNYENNVVPSFELPKLETPAFNNQNNEPVNFSGNLFDSSNQAIENLMQTTDNFNSMPNTMPSTEVPVAPAPFFVTSPEVVNNPIPVGGPANNMPMQGPSMFGQFEQNYM